MIEIGRVCVKTSGNDSGKYCVVLEQVDDIYVIVSGEVKRGKCNITHLDALPLVIDVSKNDTDEKVIQKMVNANIIPAGPKRRENKEKPKKEQVKAKTVKKVKKSEKAKKE